MKATAVGGRGIKMLQLHYLDLNVCIYFFLNDDTQAQYIATKCITLPNLLCWLFGFSSLLLHSYCFPQDSFSVQMCRLCID